MMEKPILVVYPHPDDEAFGTAGTIILHAKKGTPVIYACLTLGEMGRNLGNPPIANRETLPQIRQKELQDACAIMGIKELRLLGFRDKTLEFEEPNLLADKISEVIKEIRPSKIITYYPGHGVHPDHNACAEATILAVKQLPSRHRPVIYAQAITKNRMEALGQPDIIVDCTPVFKQKLSAIKAHRTQTENLIKQMNNAKHEMLEWLKKEYFWIYPIR
jgi:N-acetylglucosamine malate deacetylase 2